MEWIKTILCQFTVNPVVNGNNNTHLLPQALSFFFTRPPSLPMPPPPSPLPLTSLPSQTTSTRHCITLQTNKQTTIIPAVPSLLLAHLFESSKVNVQVLRSAVSQVGRALQKWVTLSVDQSKQNIHIRDRTYQSHMQPQKADTQSKVLFTQKLEEKVCDIIIIHSQP